MLFIKVRSWVCSITFDDSSVAFSATVLEKLNKVSLATSAYLAVVMFIFDIDDESKSEFED